MNVLHPRRFVTVGVRRCAVAALAAVAATTLSACAGTPQAEAPQVDRGASTQALKTLPRRQGERVAVSIYEFRSSVGEIPARGSTDMFKTALVQSGQFRVVERSRLNEGVIREKQLNASGLSTGNAGTEPLTGARYIFEGAITEANAGQTQRSAGFSVAGMEIGGSSNKDVIGLDVRVVEVATGDVVDVVTVRKSIVSDTVGVSGIGTAIGNVMSRKGRGAGAYTPDVQLQQQRKESLDLALRSAIDQAVIELAGRFPNSGTTR